MLVKDRVFSVQPGHVGPPVFLAPVYTTACLYLAAIANRNFRALEVQILVFYFNFMTLSWKAPQTKKARVCIF